MSLIDFQTAMGRMIRVPDGSDTLDRLNLTDREQASITALSRSAGFQVTVAIQRSWCEGRAAQTARLTLSMLSEEDRQRLLEEWVSSGAGTASFVEAEADRFLEFVSKRLPNPSEALTICRIERATLRASEGAANFAIPDLSVLQDSRCLLCASKFASLVHCHVEPEYLLFGPGLVGLWRLATSEDVQLWRRLAEPLPVKQLLAWHRLELLQDLLWAGIVELQGNPRLT